MTQQGHLFFESLILLCWQSTYNGVVSEADSLLYDAVWAVALALNHSTVNVTREEFRMELNSLSFIGSSVCQATTDLMSL